MLAVSALGALGAVSCGDDDASDGQPAVAAALVESGEEQQVAETVRDLQRAFIDGDVEGICELTTEVAHKQAGRAVHGTPSACGKDIRRMFAAIRKGEGWRHVGESKVTAVEISGSRAVATVARDVSRPTAIPFLKTQGRWKLSSFFGTPLDVVERKSASIERDPFPPADADDVRATRPDGTPCPEVVDTAFPTIRGGCQFKTSTADVSFRAFTVFGDFELSKCTIDYRVYADAEGRTWTSDVNVNRLKAGNEDACGDVNQCIDMVTNEPVILPWRGRIRNDGEGGFIHHMDVCLNTCVGAYTGDLAIAMRPSERGWRIDATNVNFGDDGFRMSTRMAVGPDRIELRPAAAGPSA